MPLDPRLEFVTGPDGTKIAVERRGSGRPLLLVHGTSSARGRWAPILDELTASREVFWIDRRGRGDSTDGQPYDIRSEFEDVAAVANYIGGEVDIFGHSYGAICSLMATPLTKSIGRLVLYEPPIGVIPPHLDTPDAIDKHVQRGDLSGGLEVFLSGVLKIPAALIEAMRQRPDWPQKLGVVPTISREIRAVQHFTIAPELVKSVTNEVLLVQGTDSPRPFHDAIAFLASHLPNSSVVELSGQQHQAIDTGPAVLLDGIGSFLGISGTK